MRKLSLALLSVVTVVITFAQIAPIPTSWDCSGTPPDGWTQYNIGSGNLTYTTSQLYTSAPASARLDLSGEYILIHVNDEPGLVKYNIKGSVGSGTWSGAFKTQWSIDGNTWTDMTTYTTLPVLSAPFVNAVDTPSSQARFIRFYYTTKKSGSNVVIDDISIKTPVAGPNQEIEVHFNGSKTPINGSVWLDAPVNTTANFAFKVYNLGTSATLTLSNANFTGAHAVDYTLINFPTSITAQDSGEITFSFTPSIAGTRVAKLTFDNNDADENSYEINLFGVGGIYASEPDNNPTAIIFSNIKSYSISANVSGNNADGYIVLRKLGSAVTETPTDGITYTQGEGIGVAKVFYVGNESNFNMKEMHAGLTYHFAVFSFNGMGSYTNYKQTTPLQVSQVSGKALPDNYYAGIDVNAPSFVDDLSTLINNRTLQVYAAYKSTMIDNFYARDTANGMKVVNCEYSNDLVQYTEPFDYTVLDMAREHTFASSWMPTSGTSGASERYSYSDYHNLHLTNQNKVNNPRSNFGFGEVVTPISSYKEATIGRDIDNRKVLEPRNEIKGDVARSIFYMSVCFNQKPNKTSSTSGLPAVTQSWAWDSLIVPGTAPIPDMALYLVQNEDLLKQWSLADPPSAEERARNEFAQDLQGNRNPFIDHPEWLCYIDFRSMSYLPNGANNCNATGIKYKNNVQSIRVFPNPASNSVSIKLYLQKAQSSMIELIDINGKTVYTSHISFKAGNNQFNIDTTKFAAGNYILKISGNNTSVQRKLSTKK